MKTAYSRERDPRVREDDKWEAYDAKRSCATWALCARQNPQIRRRPDRLTSFQRERIPDTANVRGAPTVDLTVRAPDRVVHLHFSELLDKKHRVVIGKGEVDFRRIFTVLKNRRYDGWVSLEPLTGGKEDLRFSIEHIRSRWNSL